MIYLKKNIIKIIIIKINNYSKKVNIKHNYKYINTNDKY